MHKFVTYRCMVWCDGDMAYTFQNENKQPIGAFHIFVFSSSFSFFCAHWLYNNECQRRPRHQHRHSIAIAIRIIF